MPEDARWRVLRHTQLPRGALWWHWHDFVTNTPPGPSTADVEPRNRHTSGSCPDIMGGTSPSQRWYPHQAADVGLSDGAGCRWIHHGTADWSSTSTESAEDQIRTRRLWSRS